MTRLIFSLIFSIISYIYLGYDALIFILPYFIFSIIKIRHKEIIGALFIVFLLFKREYIILAAFVIIGIGFKESMMSLILLPFLNNGIEAIVLLSAFAINYLISLYLETCKKYEDILKIYDEDRLKRNLEMRLKSLNEEKKRSELILNERSRISTELHHVIGHTITSALLQVGALETIASINEKEMIFNIKSTLTDGMNEIRSALHNMKDDSIDLDAKIEELVEDLKKKGFEVNLNINANLIRGERKLDVLFLVREAITNIIKHSNGNRVTINIKSHKTFDIIEVMDNGAVKKHGKDGIGIRSMREIASKYNGRLNIDDGDGFKIYLRLMR
ncbi:MAG: histidine kinase [Ezakiella sp.]|nr:histidine kinase [Ezakiella sp.]